MDVLASSVAKLKAVLRLTNDLAAGDFPNSHARDALLQISSVFSTGLGQLSKVAKTTDPAIIRAITAAESQKIFELFPLLGFLVNSTDVRNAFEIHGPFLRIVRKILGPDSKLIISSEWDFSPFTFLPPSVFGRSDIVFIGGPASEASNVLTIPLAGHELGHNVWAKQKRAEQLGPELWQTIHKHIASARWAEFQAQFPQLKQPKDLEDLIGEQTWSPAWEWALRQCEELFCDFIGMCIFRESFPHAFSYLLAPGIPFLRSVEYPATKQRATFHEQAASSYGIKLPAEYTGRFEDEQFLTQQPIKLLLEIADFGVSQLAPRLIEEAQAAVEKAGITHASDAEVAKIHRCIAQCVPCQDLPNLPAIVNAAWSHYLSGMNEWRKLYPAIANSDERMLDLLSDLVLKTIEVFEIEQRQIA